MFPSTGLPTTSRRHRRVWGRRRSVGSPLPQTVSEEGTVPEGLCLRHPPCSADTWGPLCTRRVPRHITLRSLGPDAQSGIRTRPAQGLPASARRRTVSACARPLLSTRRVRTAGAPQTGKGPAARTRHPRLCARASPGLASRPKAREQSSRAWEEREDGAWSETGGPVSSSPLRAGGGEDQHPPHEGARLCVVQPPGSWCSDRQQRGVGRGSPVSDARSPALDPSPPQAGSFHVQGR